MRFHVLGIPHTASNREWLTCAFTQKIVKMCAMLKARDHTVIHYGNEASDVVCDEHVTITRKDDIGTPDSYLAYDLTSRVYRLFNLSAVAEIERRKQPKDFLLCMWGAGHKPVADQHPDLLVVEPGIGYPGGHFAPFKVFESYAILHAYYGMKAVASNEHFNWYEVVIPNYFDPDDFTFSGNKKNYFLFLGRVHPAKGIHLAIQIAEATNTELCIAGPGEFKWPESSLVKFEGVVGLDKRRSFLSNAKALIAPSMFLEPFCGSATEAHFSGTPVISTDWGAFAENNLHGITGYRCRTFEQFTWAVQNIDKISPQACRHWAVSNFSMERVSEMYEEFFWSIMNVANGNGWYELMPERSHLSWLFKSYPGAWFPPNTKVSQCAALAV